MRLRLEAEPAELREKSAALLEQLAKALEGEAPAVAEALEVAARDVGPGRAEPRFAALRDGLHEAHAGYERVLTAMLEEMGAVIDAHVVPAPLQKAAPDYTEEVREQVQDELDDVRGALLRLGYDAADFAAGGVLEGLSVHELRAVLDERRRAAG